MKGRKIHYTANELAWLKDRQNQPRRALHAAFCAHFHRTDVSFDNLKALCTRKGWKTGRTGRFDPGQPAYNKGKKMPFHQNSAANRFQPGQLPHNHKGHGHERICKKDGYVIIIVAERNPWTGAATRPVHKHRYRWEQAHGPLPKGMALKCLDGDKTNCDPANWKAIPRALLPRLNGRFGRDFDNAPLELRPTLLAIAELEHAAREKAKQTKGKRHG